MIAAIKGRTILLHVQTVTGTDLFGKDIKESTTVEVQNVLIQPAEAEDVVSELQLTGKRLAYILHIPKGDTHVWTDTKVEFFGQTFATYGPVMEFQTELVPLDWDRRIKVEKYE